MDDQELRSQLVALLDGRDAHMSLDEAVADFPRGVINQRPPNVPYSSWQLLEHIRLTQRDILEYVRDPVAYVERAWPDDYWPAPNALASAAEWDATLAGYREDLAALREIAQTADLTAELPNTPGHTALREIRVAADHTAYHTGEFAILRQIMRTWPEGHR